MTASHPPAPATLGIRHIALFVKDPAISKNFYCGLFNMQIEWEPDPDNVYLTSSGQDNLALHRGTEAVTGSGQRLDHIGFALARESDVDEWYARAKSMGARILNEIKTHRDGARSFYLSDPDGVVIQMIFHRPIAQTLN